MSSSSDNDFDLSSSGHDRFHLSSRKWKSDDDEDELDFDVSDSEEGSLELVKACEDGDVAEAKRILNETQDVNVNCKDEMDQTPLIYATQRGLAEVVQLLLLKGANVNMKGDEGKTALFHACRRGKTAIVSILLSNGAQVNAVDDEMKTPLFYAAMQGRSEILEQLLAHGADITRKDEDGRTALFYALECDHVYLAEALLAKAREAGADLLHGSDYGDNELLLKCMVTGEANAVDEWGKTALIYACKRDCVETVKYLLERKAVDVNYKTPKSGASALFIACKHGKAQIARLLIEHGADVNAANQAQRRTALWYAIETGMADVCRQLVDKGADVNHIDGAEGRPLLWKALARDDMATAQLLLARGAAARLPGIDYGEATLLVASLEAAASSSPDADDAAGMTPLLYACKNGQMRLAKWLLTQPETRRRPSAKAADARGWTGLHFLAVPLAGELAPAQREKKASGSKERLEVAELLLAGGCDVNAKSDDGVSPFYAACLAGDRELVRLCLAHGARADTVGEAEDRPQDKDNLADAADDDDIMNVEEWTDEDDDDDSAWVAAPAGTDVMDEDDEPRPATRHRRTTAPPAPEHHFKGREDIVAATTDASSKNSKNVKTRSRSKSYRERVNIFQRAREEEAIGESGEEAINLNRGPLLINVIRRQDRKSFASAVDFDKNFLEIIRLLLDHGAAVEVRDEAEGRTPLLWACLLRNKDAGAKIVQLLLERGADVQQRDHGGNSALLLATAVGNKKVVKRLLLHRASGGGDDRPPAVDVNQKNGKGYTALVTAIQDNYKVRAMADLRGNVPIAKLLLKHGADVNLDGGGHKPLYFACSAANLEMVKLLVEHGADINHRETYSTPLITAILKGNPQVVKYLVRAGADVEAKIGGKDAFYFASMRGLRDITRILRLQGPAAMSSGSGTMTTAPRRSRSRSDLGASHQMLSSQEDDVSLVKEKVEGWEEADEADDDDEEWERASGGGGSSAADTMSLFKQRMSAVVLQDDDDEW